MTFETYYPAPFGVYNEMRSKKMAIGDNYYNGSQYCWLGTCSNPINATTDLVVEGNVGIGTVNPEAKLHIAGWSGVILDAPKGEPNGFSIRTDSVWAGWSRAYGFHNSTGAELAAFGAEGTNGNTLSYAFIGPGAWAYMTPWMAFTNAGNVGIGTTAPTAKLDVRYAGPDVLSNGLVYFGNSGANTLTTLKLGDSGYTSTRYLLRAVADTDADAGGPYDVFAIRSDGVASINGRVGIGTTSPGVQLHMYNNAAVGTHMKMQNADTGGRVWNILSSGTANSAGAGNLHIYDDGAPVTRLFIQGSTGNVGIGTVSPGYKLTVNGDTWCIGGAWSGSDIRWKENIRTLNNPLQKLSLLRGVEFNWKRDEFKANNFPEGRQIGLIAQELEKEFPELVTTDKSGYKAIAYDRFTAVLLEAIKALAQEINGLKEELAGLKKTLVKKEAR